MKKKSIIKGIILLGSVGFLIGCETGVSNQHDKTPFRSTSSDTAPAGTTHTGTTTTSHSPKSHATKTTSNQSEIKKIFSKSGTPGYYLQVGYFKNEQSASKLKAAAQQRQLPFGLIKKYEGGENHYYALVGPYRSYNEANRVKQTVRAKLTPSAFVVQVVRP